MASENRLGSQRRPNLDNVGRLRVPQWEQNLAAYIRATQEQPIEWGKNDCALWTARAVREITSLWFGDEFEGKYSDQDEAVEVLHKRGWQNLLDVAQCFIGQSIDNPACCRCGDVIYVPTRGEYADMGLLGIAYVPFGVFVGAERLRFMRLPTLWRAGAVVVPVR